MNKKIIIGLTGLIGSGKSLVAQMFMECGAKIIDTDVMAHQLTAVNGVAIAEIKNKFGAEFILQNGGLNRDKMRQLVFEDKKSKQLLESILHPLIYDATTLDLIASDVSCVIVVVPLLFKTKNFIELVDRTLFIDCDEEQIIDRVKIRNNLNAIGIKKILNAQLSREEQLNLADDIIENNGSIITLRQKVVELYNKYIAKQKKII